MLKVVLQQILSMSIMQLHSSGISSEGMLKTLELRSAGDLGLFGFWTSFSETVCASCGPPFKETCGDNHFQPTSRPQFQYSN